MLGPASEDLGALDRAAAEVRLAALASASVPVTRGFLSSS